jgi:hypothetical protein
MIMILLTGMFAKLKRLSEQMNNASLCQVWNFSCMTLAKWQKSSLICITIRTFCCEYATIPCTHCNQLLGAALTIAKLIAKIVGRAVMNDKGCQWLHQFQGWSCQFIQILLFVMPAVHLVHGFCSFAYNIKAVSILYVQSNTQRFRVCFLRGPHMERKSDYRSDMERN